MPFDREAVLAKFREFQGLLREDYDARSEGDKVPGTRYEERLRQSLRGLLGLADVTPAFRTYIEENVMGLYSSGEPVIDSRFKGIFGEPEKGNYGVIFNPGENAEAMEKGALLIASIAEGVGEAFSVPFPSREELIAQWGRQIEEKYPKA